LPSEGQRPRVRIDVGCANNFKELAEDTFSSYKLGKQGVSGSKTLCGGRPTVGDIIMMMASPVAFWNFVIVLLLLLGGGIWLFINHVSKEAEGRRRAHQAQHYHAATAIKEADLTLSDVKLAPANYGTEDFVPSGIVTNDASSALTTIGKPNRATAPESAPHRSKAG
jgi:hypothetical protein